MYHGYTTVPTAILYYILLLTILIIALTLDSFYCRWMKICCISLYCILGNKCLALTFNLIQDDLTQHYISTSVFLMHNTATCSYFGLKYNDWRVVPCCSLCYLNYFLLFFFCRQFKNQIRFLWGTHPHATRQAYCIYLLINLHVKWFRKEITRKWITESRHTMIGLTPTVLRQLHDHMFIMNSSILLQNSAFH